MRWPFVILFGSASGWSVSSKSQTATSVRRASFFSVPSSALSDNNITRVRRLSRSQPLLHREHSPGVMKSILTYTPQLWPKA